METCKLILVTLSALTLTLAGCSPASPTARSTPPTGALSPTSTALAATPTSTPIGQTVNLHAVDWAAFVASDASLDHRKFPDQLGIGPFVGERRKDASSGVHGYALVDKVFYVSLMPDNQEAAVIPLNSGFDPGTAGFLVYIAGSRLPALASVLSGLNLQAHGDNGNLVVMEELRESFDLQTNYFGTCGYQETHYGLQSNAMIVESQQSRGEPACREPAVKDFYNQLKHKQFKDAYAVLSPAYQSANPYDQWAAGYADTISFSITTSPRPDGAIGVQISSTDATATGHVPQRFSGIWSVVWSPTARRWLLDQANIARIPLSGTQALDWYKIISTDSKLTHPTNPFNLWGLTGPYVVMDPTDRVHGAYGFAMVDDIFYGNILKSGSDQAFVWLDDAVLECYATVHRGLLIYEMENATPELAAAVGGFDLIAKIKDGQLVVRAFDPPDFAFRGKCQNSGFRDTTYAWQNDHLTPVSSLAVSYGPAPDLTDTYYNLLQSKQFNAAYAMLGPSYQAAHPFDQWVMRYRNLISIHAGGISIRPTSWVVEVTSVEETSHGQLERTYRDEWVFIFVPDKSPPGKEYLDDPQDIPPP